MKKILIEDKVDIFNTKKFWEFVIKHGKPVSRYLSTALLGNMRDTAILEVVKFRLPKEYTSNIIEVSEGFEIPSWFIETKEYIKRKRLKKSRR